MSNRGGHVKIIDYSGIIPNSLNRIQNIKSYSGCKSQIMFASSTRKNVQFKTLLVLLNDFRLLNCNLSLFVVFLAGKNFNCCITQVMIQSKLT